MSDSGTHKKAHFITDNLPANGVTVAKNPLGVSDLCGGGEMNYIKRMPAKLYTAAAVSVLLASSIASADQPALRFNGGIGVIPVSAAVGCTTPNPCTPTGINRNIVRGVPPPGQIWTINQLQATVSTTGSIKVSGQGLILAGGDNAGRAPALSVFASLFCGTTESDTNLAGVALSPTGDFQINDTLSPVPSATCANPMLLIRSTTQPSPWFAVGIFNPGH
jgi:hypothetical protein